MSQSRILLQTTIGPVADDWHIGRFAMLARHLRDSGHDVVARDREAPAGSNDPLLAVIDRSDFDQLWLFAVDTGDGLNSDECAAIGRFRTRGGLMVTRDHMDLGSSVCTLGGVGAAHRFHSRNLPADQARRCPDDTVTTNISWPNYHSGANGDYQEISPEGPPHPLLADPDRPGSWLHMLPAHPHEGEVEAPADDPSAGLFPTVGRMATGRRFNIAVAFEAAGSNGRAVAQSTFHHFCDYNWDPSAGCPSFVSEAPGTAMVTNPEALRQTHAYAANLARWLGGRD